MVGVRVWGVGVGRVWVGVVRMGCGRCKGVGCV